MKTETLREHNSRAPTDEPTVEQFQLIESLEISSDRAGEWMIGDPVEVRD